MLSIFFLVQRIAICPIHNIYIYITVGVLVQFDCEPFNPQYIYLYILSVFFLVRIDWESFNPHNEYTTMYMYDYHSWSSGPIRL